MSFALVYHPRVAADVAMLSRDLRDRLSKAIRDRLTTYPERYGKPLRGSLAGYWKLRVGDYRVVYRIAGKEVWVYGMIHRKDVYRTVLKRL